jgi:vanillate/3-O-methylgallate O-demethylase
MYENFANLHPIDVEHVKMDKEYLYSLSPYAPSYQRATPFMTMGWPLLLPSEYTSWRDEAIAAQETCCISMSLNPAPAIRISGPEAAQFLKDATVNNIDKFPIGSSKHGIACAESGNIAGNGVMLRTGEDVYEVHWISPLLNIRFMAKPYDATLEDITTTRFIFQLIGPKSLQIVEEACEEDFHDLKMCRFRNGSICGHEVRVLRFGMTGGLAYEIHGNSQDAKEIHRRLIEVGNKYGVRLMGLTSYMMSHTAGGSVQFGMHYSAEIPKEVWDAIAGSHRGEEADPNDSAFFVTNGSAGKDQASLFMNPFEVGLGHIVDFSHDFVGRDALLEYKKDIKRTMVTLKWNPEDVVDIFLSQLRDEEPYSPMDHPGQEYLEDNQIKLEFDYVEDAEGKQIGISGGRTFMPWHHAMISLASLDLAHTELGSEVFVVFGEPDSRQKRVRATVVPTPFNTNYSNRTFDVESIPHYAG